MITGDPRQSGPVDARGRKALPGIGALGEKTLPVASSRFLPQAIEIVFALGVKTLGSQHRDIAMLRVDPGHGRSSEAEEDLNPLDK